MHNTDSGFSKLPEPNGTLANPPAPELLKFNIPASIKDSIHMATKRFQQEISNNHNAVLNFQDFGKNTIKVILI